LPIPKLLDYFSKSKFGKIVEGKSPSRLRIYKQNSSTVSSREVANGSGATTKVVNREEEDNAEEGSVRVMTNYEHAAILLSVSWCREVSKAIDQVGKKAEEWEQRERIELLK
jgi:hypothetical protein